MSKVLSLAKLVWEVFCSPELNSQATIKEILSVFTDILIERLPPDQFSWK